MEYANVPIVNEGKGKGYRFIGKFLQYPLDWDEEEYYSFLNLPFVLPEKYQTKAFQTAYEKVMAAHTAERKRKQQASSDIAKVLRDGKSFDDETDEYDILSKITEAVLTKHRIKAVYHTYSRDVMTKRKIDPYFLVPRGDRLYVIGYCHKSEEIRTFRLNRFRQVMLLEETFTRDHVNLEKHLQYTWSIIRGNKRIRFKVTFSKKVARYIKEEEYNVQPVLTDLPDGSLLFEVTLNHEEEFLRWLMKYGPEAEIIEPFEYREKMRKVLEEWYRVYDS